MFSVTLLLLGGELLIGSTSSAPPLSLSALVLCFFDWTWNSICLGFRLENSFMSSKPKPLAQPSFYHWKKRNTMPPFATFLSFYFSTFSESWGGKGYYLLNISPRRPQHMLTFHWGTALAKYCVDECCNVGYVITTLHSLCYLALGSSPPHTLNLHFVSVELGMEGKIPYSDL